VPEALRERVRAAVKNKRSPLKTIRI
jgi:hypothetical protein